MARHQKNIVHLTDEERTFLEQQTKSGKWTPREVQRAKILLLAEINGQHVQLDQAIADTLGCSLSAVSYRRKRFATTQSVEDTIFDKARSGRPTIIDGAVDAHMTTIACSEAPDGRLKWTLKLIKDRLISLEVIENISSSTIGRALKKKKSNLG